MEHVKGYKMILNYRGKYAALDIPAKPHCPKTMKNSYTLILDLYQIYLFSVEPTSVSQYMLELIKSCKMILNDRDRYETHESLQRTPYLKFRKSFY